MHLHLACKVCGLTWKVLNILKQPQSFMICVVNLKRGLCLERDVDTFTVWRDLMCCEKPGSGAT
jgi:hypothetical protein